MGAANPSPPPALPPPHVVSSDHMRLLLPILLCTATAHAVVVRGKVTGPLGSPVPGARVQLIQGQRSVGDAVADLEGNYEIRSNAAGRFLLLTSSTVYAPQIGDIFYGGRSDLIQKNVLLDRSSITPVVTRQPGGLQSSLLPLADAPTLVHADRLLPDALIASEVPLAPATFLLQTGQTGQPALFFLRGADPEANAVELDGISITNLGGRFNFGTLAATGLAASSSSSVIEISVGPNPFGGPHAEAGQVNLATPSATSLRPTFEYAGDAGTLHTWRDQATVGLTRLRADLLASASRFDTSNAIANDRFHVATIAAAAGYQVSGNTGLRLTLRDEASAAPLPIPSNLGYSPLTRDAAQNIYSSFVFDTRTPANWHNQLRAGVVRKREQVSVYNAGTAHLVAVKGANGATAVGTASIPLLPPREDFATNRDEITYATNYPLLPTLSGALQLRYENVRGLDATGLSRQTVKRENFTAAAALQGHYRHRIFAEASGDLNHSNLLGFTGDPRLGVTLAAVRPGERRFRGTILHALISTGTREPGLTELAQGANVAARARTVVFSADQNILGPTLTLHADYFHNQFTHQVETLSVAPLVLSQTLAHRTQGFTSELRYLPRPRLFLRGGYTYLASLVERSASVPAATDASPGVGVGVYTALQGQRLFHRPPHTGYFDIQYSGSSLSANLHAAMVGRADGSTANRTVLLPNRNVDYAYTLLDAGLAYTVNRHVSFTLQALNLLNQEHAAPIGYPSTPFTVRTGLRIRLGGE